MVCNGVDSRLNSDLTMGKTHQRALSVSNFLASPLVSLNYRQLKEELPSETPMRQQGGPLGKCGTWGLLEYQVRSTRAIFEYCKKVHD